jgi:hypothetical protein
MGVKGSPQAPPARRRSLAGIALGLCLLLLGGTFAATRVQARTGAALGTPTVTITSSPASPTTSTTATVAFVTSEARKVKCSLDGANFSRCDSPVVYDHLAVGKHVAVVKAINDDLTTTATARWEVITTAPSTTTTAPSTTTGAPAVAIGTPTVTITSSPASPTTSTTATVAFATSEARKVKCSLDGDNFSRCDSPVVYDHLAVGKHVAVVKAIKGDFTATATARWEVVTTAPSTATTTTTTTTTTPTTTTGGPAATLAVTSSIPNGATLTGSLAWTATTNRSVTKIQFFIDGTLKWTENYAPYEFNGDGNKLDTTTLANANHTLKVVALAGDGTQAEVSASVKVANGAAPPPPGPTTTGAGRVQYVAPKADSSMLTFIGSSTAAQQQWMRDHWQRAIVSWGYWDSKLPWYPNAWAYVDTYAIYNGSTVATQHPEWILKDSSGKKLYIPFGCSGGTCPQYAADIGSSAWRQDYINRCKTLIAMGYKGIFADDVNLDMNVGNGSGQQVTPIDPRTGQPMTDASWKSYFAGFMEQLRAAIPSAEIVHNSVWFAGGGQHDATQPEIVREIKAADYVNMERGLNDSGLTGGTGAWSVYALMRFIDNVHAYGRHVILLSHTSDVVAAEYNLAGYFLINDGRDYLSSQVGKLPSNAWAGYSTNLGDATGRRYLWNGVWRRDFTRGFVLLNEPGSSTKTLALGGTFKTTAGKSVTSVTLGAAQGAVLAS